MTTDFQAYFFAYGILRNWSKSVFCPRVALICKKGGYQENKKCVYMPWGPLCKWAELGVDFEELSPSPTCVMKT